MLNLIRKISSKLSFGLRYLGSPPWDSGVSPPELIEHLEHHSPGRALDLGCGTGTNVITLRKYGWVVTGVDFVSKAIREARRKARKARVDVTLKTGDVSDPAMFDGPYDLILDIGCYHSLNPDQKPLYRRLVANHLDEEGTYMMYGFIAEEGVGIRPEEVSEFKQLMNLERREDSADGTGPTSAWFWFQPKE
jgi:cyclopropane fatty-acyl-phospholipid synthase-like methyltransferase